MTHFHAGQNMPGYLPMADEPATFETFEAAKAYQLEELERSGDSIFETGEDENMRALADDYSAAAEELNLENGPEWATTLPLSTSEHDLGLSFWIVQCEESECEEELDDF